jgi:hypothetical protein
MADRGTVSLPRYAGLAALHPCPVNRARPPAPSDYECDSASAGRVCPVLSSPLRSVKHCYARLSHQSYRRRRKAESKPKACCGLGFSWRPLRALRETPLVPLLFLRIEEDVVIEMSYPPERFGLQPILDNSAKTASQWSPWISSVPFLTVPPAPSFAFNCFRSFSQSSPES